ncbi:MAG: GAF domain-containing protein, partial [Chloroflexota bacterium]
MTEQPLRVLLIEDEISLSGPLAKYLEKQYNYQVDLARTEKQVWEALEQTQGLFDVVLIDNMLMPDDDQEPEPLGIQLLTDIKASYAEVECILFTGWGMENSGLEALRAGAYRYLAKPFAADELGFHIRMAAESMRIRKERDLLAATLKITQSITQGLSTNEIINTIINTIPDLIGIEVCTMVLLDIETNALKTFNSEKNGHFTTVWRRHLQAKPLTRPILESGQSYEVPNVDSSADIDKNLKQSGVKSFIGIPVSDQSDNIGVLYAYSKRIDAFSDQDRQILQLSVEQTAIALKNARLFEAAKKERDRSKKMASQLLALQEISHEIQSELELSRLLNTVSRLATELLGVDSGGVLLFEDWALTEPFPDDKRHLGFAGSYALGKKIVQETRDLLGGSIAGRVAQSGIPIIANDLPNDPRFENPAAEDEDFQAVMSTPLRIGGKIIGTLDVHSKDNAQAFDDEGLKLLTLLANQAAIAIANAQHLNEIQTSFQTLSTLYRAGNTILSANAPEAVLKRVTEHVCQALGCWRIKLALISTEGEIEELALVGFENGLDSTALIRSDGISMQVTRTQDIWYSNDVRNAADQINPVLIEDNVRAAACVPLGQEKGVMWIHYQEVKYFSPLELEALKLYANQISIALTNTELISQLQEQRDHLNLLLEASNTVSRSYSTTQGMSRLAKMLVTYLDMTFCRILLMTPDESALQIRAVYPSPQDSKLFWKPRLNEYIKLDEFEGLTPFLQAGNFKLFERDSDNDNQNLDLVKHRLHLKEDIHSLLWVPLRIDDRVIGLLGLGDIRLLQDAPISKVKQDAAMAIAEQTATLIDRLRLQRRAETERQRLQSFYEASSTSISSQDPPQVLTEIVEKARDAAQAVWVSVILIDEMGQAQGMIEAGKHTPFDLQQTFRKDGISAQVLFNGEIDIIPDTQEVSGRIHMSPFWDNIGASLCFPISLRGHRFGVMWVQYTEPQAFSDAEIKALELYVNQAAIAYDSAQKLDELKHMQQAAAALASVASLQEVLTQIVHSAKTVMKADSAVIWSYDAIRDRFNLNQS